LAARGGGKGSKTKKKAKDGKKKDKRKATKAATVPRPNPDASAPHAGLLLYSTAKDLEGAWVAYGQALAGWVESAASLQKSAASAAFSWLEMWRRVVEVDTEVLRGSYSYWEERWQDTCAESARQHLRVAASVAESYSGAVRDAHAEYLEGYGRQWARLFGL